MSSFIGPWGQLIEFKCPSSLEVSSESRSSFATTLGGRVVEQRGPRGRRTWQASIATANPSQVASLEALDLGILGSPPWVWVPPQAQSQNLFSPDGSVMMPGTYSDAATPSNSATASDGTFVPRTVIMQPNTTMVVGQRDLVFDPLPTIPGKPLTVSVYASGAGGSLRVIFRDIAGGYVGTFSEPLPNSFNRCWVKAVAPAKAVDVLVQIIGGPTSLVRVGAPSATWSETVVPWSVGRGCNRVTVDGLSESLQMAILNKPRTNRSAFQFTVKELG